MLPAGKSLRTLREKLGLTMRDIETSSARIAEKYRNEEFSDSSQPIVGHRNQGCSAQHFPPLHVWR